MVIAAVISYTPPPLADRREESQPMDGVESSIIVGLDDDMYRLSLAERSRGQLKSPLLLVKCLQRSVS